jgi:hypothetical protein
MGIVRDHIVADDAALAQWMFRKLANHDPMKHRCPMNRVGRDKETPLVAANSATSVLYPLKDGRVFMLSVKELTDTEIAEQRQALGTHYVERKEPRKITIKKKAQVGA